MKKKTKKKQGGLPKKQLSIGKKCVCFFLLILLAAYVFLLPKQLFSPVYSTVVNDRDGNLLGARIASDGQWRFPRQGKLNDKYVRSLLQFEDKYFYYHWGVNPVSIVRAFSQNVKNKKVVSGGSTLTMQTVRLIRGKKRTYVEKLIELLWATRLEFRCTKAEILSLYASHAPFGGNVVGLDAAAWKYFNHSQQDLTWAEAATLAVLPNAPSRVHVGKNRQRLMEKRNKLLKSLYQNGTIGKSDYFLALEEKLPEQIFRLPTYAPHLVEWFAKQKQTQQIAASIELSFQSTVEQIVERWAGELSLQGINNIAVMVVDVPSNEVLAYCANVKGSQVDIIQSPRSTGSILKPFLYYAALNDGLILPTTLLADIPININGFAPQNFNYQYDGAVPANEVISRSLNVPSVLLLQKYGVDRFHHFLSNAGISTLTKSPSHYGLSLILGGAEATLWDLSTLYSNMARSLLELPPTALKLEKGQPDSVLSQTYHPAAAWHCLQALTDVNRPEEIDWKTIPSMQKIAWKTGTSFGFRDAWAIGLTPHYLVAVWVGNASGEGNPYLIGARTAGPILFDLFNLLPSSKWFQLPEKYFVEEYICPQSGCLKGRFCPETDTALVSPKGHLSEACNYHVLVQSKDGKSTKVAFVLPPVWAYYYKQRNPLYQSESVDVLSGQQLPMQFVYPTANYSKLSLPKTLAGKKGEATLELVHTNPQAIVYWHVNQSFVGTTQDIHKLTLPFDKGRHRITAIDDKGNSITAVLDVE